MIKRISDEWKRINAYNLRVGTESFFYDRVFKEDMEWLTRAYLAEITE
ncbi:MAG: hypothetical protein NTV93_05620 [Verrucomicrobia bacterium]|nr:hypothetical protein [Verrucomicrobiota bacterium]